MLAPPLLRSRFSSGAAFSRLGRLAHDLAGTADDLTLTFSHNPAGQIVGNTRSNDLYSVGGLAAGTVASAVNGLNQLVTQGGAAVAHDANGNLISDGTSSYAYSSENLLTGAGGVTLRYDPLMRLAEVADGSTVRFAYDGVDRIADYDANGVLVRRYVHGPGMDEPLVWYVGSDVVYRRWLHADERGSIVAASVNAGTALATRAYDEYGNSTGQGDVGPFRYTGQTWVPEAGLYYYKARMYAPELGRFVQTDPIGYAGGMNLYAYVLADPVNLIDPDGMCPLISTNVYDIYDKEGNYHGQAFGDWVSKPGPGCDSGAPPSGGGTSGPFAYGGGGGGGVIVVTGKRLRPQKRKLSRCAVGIAAKVLDEAGLPTSHLTDVGIYASLDESANVLTRRAYNSGLSVTQGRNIYRQPNITVATMFEEIAHTAQFEALGPFGFYIVYGTLSIHAMSRGEHYYDDNALERQAKELSIVMVDMYRDGIAC